MGSARNDFNIFRRPLTFEKIVLVTLENVSVCPLKSIPRRIYLMSVARPVRESRNGNLYGSRGKKIINFIIALLYQ